MWAPDTFASIDPASLNDDVFYPNPFDVSAVATESISDFLASEPNALVIADTFREPSDMGAASLGALKWFSVTSPSAGEKRVCVFCRSTDFNSESYAKLLGEASPYTTTIVVTSLRHPELLTCGMDLDEHPQLLDELLARTAQVMLGVFDERSLFVWKRTGH